MPPTSAVFLVLRPIFLCSKWLCLTSLSFKASEISYSKAYNDFATVASLLIWAFAAYIHIFTNPYLNQSFLGILFTLLTLLDVIFMLVVSVSQNFTQRKLVKILERMRCIEYKLTLMGSTLNTKYMKRQVLFLFSTVFLVFAAYSTSQLFLNDIHKHTLGSFLRIWIIYSYIHTVDIVVLIIFSSLLIVITHLFEKMANILAEVGNQGLGIQDEIQKLKTIRTIATLHHDLCDVAIVLNQIYSWQVLTAIAFTYSIGVLSWVDASMQMVNGRFSKNLIIPLLTCSFSIVKFLGYIHHSDRCMNCVSPILVWSLRFLIFVRFRRRTRNMYCSKFWLARNILK